MDKVVNARSLVIGCAVLALAACASAPRQGMYWGNYEASLYRLADAPSERVKQQHLSNLRQVVNVSDARGWLPPPGAMLELAAMEMEMGNYDTYALLVNREYQLYPESRQYIYRWFGDVMVTKPAAEETDTEAASPGDDAPASTTPDENGNANNTEGNPG